MRTAEKNPDFFGKDIYKKGKEIREDIGVVLDGTGFHETLKAREIGRFMGKIYKNWDEKYYQRLLKTFEVPGNKPMKEFSTGMKMKLMIVAAMAHHHPKLLILDEATSGLDLVVRDEILDLFLEFIQDEEHSVLISSHITSDLEKVADYITFIHKKYSYPKKKRPDYGRIWRCSLPPGRCAIHRCGYDYGCQPRRLRLRCACESEK